MDHMPDNVGTVLVVDDDEEMRGLIHDVLQDYGHRVSVASNGREALKQLSEEHYAVVLTDLRMKEMQEIESLIKRTYPDINVILMTVARPWLRCVGLILSTTIMRSKAGTLLRMDW
jgi:DNA-binding NtrC family response regulator